jgi:hypothetical protein
MTKRFSAAGKNKPWARSSFCPQESDSSIGPIYCHLYCNMIWSAILLQADIGKYLFCLSMAILSASIRGIECRKWRESGQAVINLLRLSPWVGPCSHRCCGSRLVFDLRKSANQF